MEIVIEDKIKEQIAEVSEMISDADKVFVVGNGGSSYVALHFTSDLRKKRDNVFCLCENVGTITALTNDYDFDHLYTEQLRIHDVEYSDVLIIFSVNGSVERNGKIWSANLLNLARAFTGRVVLVTGNYESYVAYESDIVIDVRDRKYAEDLFSIVAHEILWEI